MNAKKAKQLRRIARKESYAQVTGYKERAHPARLVKTGGLNADGTPTIVYYTPITLTCADHGFRSVYRLLKKVNK